MKRLFYLFFLTPFTGFAQLGTIKDADGFCNVREKPDAHSKIKDTVQNDRLVYSYPDDTKGEWLSVNYIKKGSEWTGFIHQSRVIFINKYKALPVKIVNENTLTVGSDSFQLTIVTGPFRSAGRVLQYGTPGNPDHFLTTIDKQRPWGVDGDLPKKEYRKFRVQIGADTINALNYTKDVFNPTLSMTHVYFDAVQKRYYIIADNSDGAGGYMVAWIFNKKGLIQRVVTNPY